RPRRRSARGARGLPAGGSPPPERPDLRRVEARAGQRRRGTMRGRGDRHDAAGPERRFGPPRRVHEHRPDPRGGPMSVQTFDPISVEIQRKALENITNEMAIALTRTSGSPVVYEVQDFATSLMDAEGDHLSLSATVLFHSGSSLLGTRAVIDWVRDS